MEDTLYLGLENMKKPKLTWTWLKFLAALSITGGAIYALQSLNSTHDSQRREQPDIQQTSRIISDGLIRIVNGPSGSKPPQELRSETCRSPVENIAYLKIHKTGSSTVSKIINRFGYLRNLSFLLPEDVKAGRGYVWEMKTTNDVRTTRLGHSASIGSMPTSQYNLFTLHTTYNLRILGQFMAPGSQYVTSLREPVGQFESAFMYYQFGLALPREVQRQHSVEEQLRAWFKKPDYYKIEYKDIVETGQNMRSNESYLFTRNSQMRDLGLDMQQQEDGTKVLEHIAKLDGEMDFVLIMEYFDESLVLMKKQFCWDIEDIVYIPENQRPGKMKSTSLSGDVTSSIQQWNSADQSLYLHFNRTFWEKIGKYGPSFESDLSEFRNRLEEVFKDCIEGGEDKERFARVKYILRKKAPDYCKLLAMSKNDLMDIIRQRQPRLPMDAPS